MNIHSLFVVILVHVLTVFSVALPKENPVDFLRVTLSENPREDSVPLIGKGYRIYTKV